MVVGSRRGSLNGLLMLVGLLPLLLLGSLASCSVPAPALSTTRAPAVTASVHQGWVPYDDPVNGFAIALPADFKSYRTDPKDIDKTVSDLKDTDPEVASLLEWLKAHPGEQNAKVVFYAIDVSPEARADLMPTINVVKEYFDYGISLDQYARGARKSLEQNLDVQKPVAQDRIRTKNGEFEEMRANIEPSGSSIRMADYSVCGVNGNVGYVLGLSASAEQMDKYGPIFDQIIQTFQLKAY